MSDQKGGQKAWNEQKLHARYELYLGRLCTADLMERCAAAEATIHALLWESGSIWWTCSRVFAKVNWQQGLHLPQCLFKCQTCIKARSAHAAKPKWKVVGRLVETDALDAWTIKVCLQWFPLGTLNWAHWQVSLSTVPIQQGPIDSPPPSEMDWIQVMGPYCPNL